MTLRYRLKLKPDDNGTVLVTSPDFPPLATFGSDEADAKRQASDAIEAVLTSLMDAREPIPMPTSTARGPHIALSLRTSLKVELYRKMLDAGMTRADLQRRLGWHRESVDRLFRLDHHSKIDQLEEAFRILGQDVEVRAIEAAA